MSGIWLSSCKTSRNIDTQKQIDYSGDFLYLRNLIESLRLDVNKQTKITTDKLRDLKIEKYNCLLICSGFNRETISGERKYHYCN